MADEKEKIWNDYLKLVCNYFYCEKSNDQNFITGQLFYSVEMFWNLKVGNVIDVYTIDRETNLKHLLFQNVQLIFLIPNNGKIKERKCLIRNKNYKDQFLIQYFNIEDNINAINILTNIITEMTLAEKLNLQLMESISPKKCWNRSDSILFWETVGDMIVHNISVEDEEKVKSLFHGPVVWHHLDFVKQNYHEEEDSKSLQNLYRDFCEKFLKHFEKVFGHEKNRIKETFEGLCIFSENSS